MPSIDKTFSATPDPLSRRRDDDHPLLWYYIGLAMGWLSRDGMATRERRYAVNRATKKGMPSSDQSTFVDHAR